jgi:3,4-dehydroadipyl-CoA semialdehyde dehydrogenase
MTERLLNHLGGQWIAGTGRGIPLFDPVLGTELVSVDATGLDLAAGFERVREQGGARTLNFHHRCTALQAHPDVLAALG